MICQTAYKDHMAFLLTRFFKVQGEQLKKRPGNSTTCEGAEKFVTVTKKGQDPTILPPTQEIDRATLTEVIISQHI